MKRQENDQKASEKTQLFLWLYDPNVEIVNLNVNFDTTTQTLTNTELGTVKVSQVVENNGQGLYHVVECAKFGKALIKYLKPNSDVVDQVRNFEAMGFHRAFVKAIRDAENYRNQEREILFVNELNHPNITKVLAFLSPDGTKERINALVIEDATEGVLKSYVERIGTQFTDRKIKQFALQLASALRYCHKLNIMHRDVRPENIYVHWDGNQIKLGNFGYARTDDQNFLLRTANKGDDVVYKAPEIIKNQALASYGKSVDVYSYGMVVWYMAHRGKEPFKECSERINQSHTWFKSYLEVGNRPRIEEDVDNLIAKIIRSCWINESKVNHRPTMEEICRILKKSNLVPETYDITSKDSTRQQAECEPMEGIMEAGNKEQILREKDHPEREELQQPEQSTLNEHPSSPVPTCLTIEPQKFLVVELESGSYKAKQGPRTSVWVEFQVSIHDIKQGAQACVFKASHPVYGQVEVEEMNNELMQNSDHDNIIQLIGILTDTASNFLGYIMPHMSMGIIHNKSQKYDQKCVDSWITKICSALSFLHSRSIIHRDIKPSNVLLGTSFDDVKLSDFGTARLLERMVDQTLSTGRGTPIYTAPEIIKRQKYYSLPIDIYSLSITIWEILYKRIPYDHVPSKYYVTSQICEGVRPELHDKLLAEVSQFLERCWHDNPSERPEIRDVIRFSETIGFPLVHLENASESDLEQPRNDDFESNREVPKTCDYAKDLNNDSSNEFMTNVLIKSEDELKLQTEDESTEDGFTRVRSIEEGCYYIKLNILRDEQEFIKEYKEQILSLPMGDESDECPTERLAISKNTTKAWLINHSNKENFALAKFNCEYIMQPKYFLTDSINPTTVTGILYEDAPLGNIKKFIEQRISNGRPVSDQEVLTWGLHLVTAIKHLHSKKIMHRAICPSHVFVYENNGKIIVKLGGLSFARKETNEKITSNKNPWFTFSAPETISTMNVAKYDRSSDIYSFGMMLYYMSHECKPMFPEKEERSRTELLRHLSSGNRPTLRENLNEDLAKVITACWLNESKYDKKSLTIHIRPTANTLYDWLHSNMR